MSNRRFKKSSKRPNLANPQILKKVFVKMDVLIMMNKNTKTNYFEMSNRRFKKSSKRSNIASPQILKKSIRENRCFHHNQKKHNMKPS